MTPLNDQELGRIELLKMMKQREGLNAEREIELNDLLDRKKAEDAAKKAERDRIKKVRAKKAAKKKVAKKVAKKKAAKAKRKKK